MFERILAWLKEAWNKVIGQSSVKEAMRVDIALSTEMQEALQTWSLMYANQAPWLSADIKSLNLPAAIAGEIARAVTIEMKVNFSGSARATFLLGQLSPVLDILREQVEKGCAKGGLMLKPYVKGDQIEVDFVQADMFYPVNFDPKGNIDACIFVDQRTIGKAFYTRLEYHRMNGRTCEIQNFAFRSDARDMLGQRVPLSSIEDWAGLSEIATVSNIDRPLFAYFRYPLANNIDPTSPLGVSCYARAVELIEEADRLWSNLIWEFESGKRAIYVDPDAFEKDPTTGIRKIPDRRLYRLLSAVGSLDDNAELFKEWSPDFREASIKSGLDAILKRIEFACGLAYGSISDPQTVDKTATEITTSKQRTYATIVDGQKALRTALEQLIWAMDQYATIYKLAPGGSYTTEFDFDDSVIVDKDAQMMADRQTVTMGAMPKWLFLVRNYGLDEATARKWIGDVQAEQPQDVFGNQGA